jgi:hypothetical protein
MLLFIRHAIYRLVAHVFGRLGAGCVWAPTFCYVCMYIRMYVCVYDMRVCVCMYISMCCMCACMYVYVCMYVLCVRIHKFISLGIIIYTCTRAEMQIQHTDTLLNC